ncbi:MAG: putative metal-dependent RNase containing RNA-binding KH domain [Candidatus Methanohalarchaeum thermophilum]|uniref:Transcription termination factor FttA n=1 Tax=Methanohalarchaeum thermophilum TaxID=1903181 RepID=A0A1Q6DXF0_METT1|nr:MAG: putative metal-dependent RNase containing RNA-binding KH domain [Candidatus Methanohalarchaeum thermophilum]
MTIEEKLDEIRDQVVEEVPNQVEITNVDFEGPEVVIYTRDPREFAQNGDMVRELAKKLQKRVTVRPDSNVLSDPEKADKKIKEIVPDDAGITGIYFDSEFGEATVEAHKPGLVIGKYGSTLREITKHIGWSIEVIRTPPIESKIIESLREYNRSHSEERKKILKRIGKEIHRDPSSKEEWVRTTFLGGSREVGRSSYLLSTPNSKILIDCGVKPGSNSDGTPYLYVPEVTPIDDLDAVVLTHSHLDHSGLIPLLYKYGYDGPVYCTAPTRDLMALLQLDYIDIAARDDRKVPYNSKMVREVVKHAITLEYGEVTDISPDIKLTLHNAGHILGSSMAHFHVGEGLYNVTFTGDFNFGKSRLFDSASRDFPRVETLITESTYGGSKDYQPSRKEAENKLKKAVQNTINRGGKALIPAFAVGRSQEVMLVLEEQIRHNKIDEVPVYLDGMIWDATAIHTAYPEYLNEKIKSRIFHKEKNPFLADIFKKVDSQQMREKVMEGDPCVILSTSGMLSGGPILEYLRYLGPEKENSLTFVGYQAEGTLGRRIEKGWDEVSLPGSNEKTNSVKINLNVNSIEGFSGHSDRKDLVKFIRKMKSNPERILTIHGDEQKCIDLASTLYKKFHVDTRAPKNLETIRFL